jgi:3-hydroxybutyryl-CoA dehydrogenase
MGRSIAEKIAASGIDVILLEVSAERAAAAAQELAAELDQELAHWGITAAEKKAILARVRFTAEIRDLASAELVIEAVHEDLAVKRDLFRALDAICPADRIFITNTSSLSVTEIAALSGRADRVVGMHFLHPVTRSPIVELVRSADTSQSTLDTALALAAVLGKRVVEVFDSPGYIATRAMVPFLNEAMHLVMEGVATADDVDLAIQLGYEFRMGPLEYADRVGLDKVIGWMEHLSREFGDLKFRPCPLLRQLVRAGHLGRKSGRGFHTWVNGERMLAPPRRNAT